jgi:sugar lactone lactonase YvrE
MPPHPIAAIPPCRLHLPAGPFGDPLPANKVATLIKAQAGSLEGPVWVEGQNALYFCVVGPVAGAGRIDKYSRPPSRSPRSSRGVDVAGLALSPKGAIVATAFDKRMLSEFDPGRASAPTSRLEHVHGQAAEPDNDLVVRSDGNIYFTDTDYRQDGRAGQETTAHYRFSPTCSSPAPAWARAQRHRAVPGRADAVRVPARRRSPAQVHARRRPAR